MIDLDIVIVNWNTGPQLQECLQSILHANSTSVLRLCQFIVVDDASVESLADGLEDLPLPLTIARNHENKGFAYAGNQGAESGAAEYLLFLNPDIKLFGLSVSEWLVLNDGFVNWL
jgi:GT2 family glycosyltransferase